MTLHEQLFNDTNKDLLTALGIDAELFARKYTRRSYHVHVNDEHDTNIYSERVSRYETFEDPQEIPMRMVLNPSEDDLTKYGIAQERDSLLVLCRKLMEDEFNIIPKIGDRIDHEFTDDDGLAKFEQYEVKDVKRTDMFRDSGYFMRYVLACSKTHKARTT